MSLCEFGINCQVRTYTFLGDFFPKASVLSTPEKGLRRAKDKSRSGKTS